MASFTFENDKQLKNHCRKKRILLLKLFHLIHKGCCQIFSVYLVHPSSICDLKIADGKLRAGSECLISTYGFHFIPTVCIYSHLILQLQTEVQWLKKFCLATRYIQSILKLNTYDLSGLTRGWPVGSLR